MNVCSIASPRSATSNQPTEYLHAEKLFSPSEGPPEDEDEEDASASPAALLAAADAPAAGCPAVKREGGGGLKTEPRTLRGKGAIVMVGEDEDEEDGLENGGIDATGK